MFNRKKKNHNYKPPHKTDRGKVEVISDVSIVDVEPVGLDKKVLKFFENHIKNYKEEERRGPKTKYKPQYCMHVIKEMAKGHSLLVVSIEMGFMPSRLYSWAKKNPEFKYALDVGRKLCKRWWLRQGHDNLYNKDFNNVLWMMIMSNVYGWSSSKVQANMKSKTLIENRKTIDFNINNKQAAEILRVLKNAGGIEKTIGVLEAPNTDDVIEVKKIEDKKEGGE